MKPAVGAWSHFLEVVDDPTYLPNYNKRTSKKNPLQSIQSNIRRCPVCCLLLGRRENVFWSHLATHQREAHEKTTQCGTCGEELDTVTAYFDHLKTHHNREKRAKSCQQELRECQFCKRKLKSQTAHQNHVRLCRRLANGEYLMCHLCDYRTGVYQQAGFVFGHFFMFFSVTAPSLY